MPVSPLARQTRCCLALLAVAILVFLYLPIAFLILFSFEKADTPGFPITGLTTHWYEKMLTDSAIHTALFNSIEVAIVVATLATIIGTMAAFPLVRGGIRFAGSGRLLFTLPIMIPGVLIGIGLLIFFRRAIGFQFGLHTVIAGHLVFAIDASNGRPPTSGPAAARRSATSCCRSSRRPSSPGSCSA
jgi:spermidine/putrescine transport system permease protein